LPQGQVRGGFDDILNTLQRAMPAGYRGASETARDKFDELIRRAKSYGETHDVHSEKSLANLFRHCRSSK